MLPILYYNQLDSKSVQKNFDKVLQQLSVGDFKSADVRKMSNTGYFRARLNIKDRLLFTIVAVNQKKHLLLLEVIQHHDYAKSRFLRGALDPMAWRNPAPARSSSSSRTPGNRSTPSLAASR